VQGVFQQPRLFTTTIGKELATGRTLELLQLRVLCPDFLQDGDAGVGVFPEGEEILIGGLGLRRVALSGVDQAGTEK
jgi:hypothetical protein